MKLSRHTHSRQRRGAWENQGFAGGTRPFRLGKSLPEWPEPPEQGRSSGQILAENTPLPRKLRQEETPFWLRLAVIFTVGLVGFCFLWFWWGTLPR